MRKTTAQRGYGWRHQRRRRQLLAQHTDGTPCWWCGQPMYTDPTRNPDRRPLEADHTNAVHYHGPNELADRLLHSTCNRSRQQGDRDNERPAMRARATPGATAFEW